LRHSTVQGGITALAVYACLGRQLILRSNVTALNPHPSVITEGDIGPGPGDVLRREGSGPVLKRFDRGLEFAQALVDLVRQILSGLRMGELDLLYLLTQRVKPGLVLRAQRLDGREHAPQAICVIVGEVVW